MSTHSFEDEADREIHDYLLRLDTLRIECEKRGDFIRAQECVNRMREVNFRQAKRIERLSRVANADARSELTDSHRLELLTFTRVWEEKLAEYDQKASEAVLTLKESHMSDYANQEGMLRLQLLNRRPRFSRTVVDLRSQLEKYVQLRRYLEADDIKRKLAAAEHEELAAFDASLSSSFERKAQGLKKQYINELRALEQKIKMGRDELVCQQKYDLERLLRSHANAIKELDSETKLHIAKTRKVIERQVTVLANDPVKTGVDFKSLKQSMPKAGSRHASKMSATSSTSRMMTNRSRPASAGWDDDSRYLW